MSPEQSLRNPSETIGRAIRLDLVIVACAASAGAHGALIPEHLAEGPGPGGGFIAAALLLAAFAIGLTRRPAETATLVGTALALAGLIVSYGFAITTGVPLLHPEVEPVARLAVATKTVEAGGLIASLQLLRQGRVAPVKSLQPKGTPT
jgi:hypothetical protein